ncbi:energy-coupling factor transporter transmembrane component T family protein [Schlesneria paludicola]|uniref:energy-coupling factor transporter transmembrane component T family protein n=1 Tax=Schlesneria paludicola TaxID=360056 RepID=UPI000299D60D|nr:energy-coupling factor transporter transmembrane component T [Schlesneria paludicola]
MPPSSITTTDNPCRALPASLRLAITLAVILLASLIPLEHWPAHGLLLVVVFVGLSFAGVTLGYLIRRLALFLPMLFMFGLTVPLTQWDKAAAWSWMLALWIRCTTSFLAGLWLIHVLPFPELLATLLRWRCPTLLIAMLSFMYRYIFILWDELARLRHARDARDFGHGSLKMKWVGNAQLIGLLLLRAMERAERTHHAMLSRGWDGSIRFLDSDRGTSR